MPSQNQFLLTSLNSLQMNPLPSSFHPRYHRLYHISLRANSFGVSKCRSTQRENFFTGVINNPEFAWARQLLRGRIQLHNNWVFQRPEWRIEHNGRVSRKHGARCPLTSNHAGIRIRYTHVYVHVHLRGPRTRFYANCRAIFAPALNRIHNVGQTASSKY